MEHFTFDDWKTWDKRCENDIINQCKEIFKTNPQSSTLSYLIHKLILKTFQNALSYEQFAVIIKELIEFDMQFLIILTDVLCISDGEFSDVAGRKFFYELLGHLDGITSGLLLRERVEVDTLQEAGVMDDKSFSAKFIKVKTKLYYKQNKFNLLQEECEGYAKVVVELNEESAEALKPEKTLNIIMSLIGCFNLDPNRVLDLMLESFERRTQLFEFYIPLITGYMNNPKLISDIICFKFRSYQDETVPDSLYIVSALLLQYNLADFNIIFHRLTPNDLLIWNEYEKTISSSLDYARKLHVVSLKDKDKDNEEIFDENMKNLMKFNSNQKFRLCWAFLEVGDWTHSLNLINQLPEAFVMDQQPIAFSLCRLIKWVIEPLYVKHSKIKPKISTQNNLILNNSKAIKQISEFDELRNHVFPMLHVLGPSIYYDPVLIYKTLRLLKVILDQPEQKSENEQSFYYDILTLLDVCLLPSLSYLECNCCVSEELWLVLKNYPYHHRYPLYHRLKNETYQDYPKLIRKRSEAQKQIKNIMKRISKENVKPVGRLIGKLSHNSPGILFDYILLQIQSYDNLISPVIDSLKYLTNLSYDILVYCLIESLVKNERSRFKHDGTSISMWLQNLSAFCGAIFKKYNMELTGLLQFVANQLKDKRSADLLILKEIVNKMTGIEIAEELTMTQLNAMSGGELLKAEAGYFSQVRNMKKSSLRLKEALSEDDLAVTLCLLIAQQKNCIIFNEHEDSHLKLVGKLFDDCQDTLVQFGNFLGSTLSVDEYTSKLPSIGDMLTQYHIQLEVAFFLARPMFSYSINLKFDQFRKSESNFKKLPTSIVNEKYHEITKEMMNPVVESVIPLYTLKIWEDLSCQFLVTFWSLVMSDLRVPIESYNNEISKLKQLALHASENKDLTTSKAKKEQDRCNALIEKLNEERRKQQEHVNRVMYRLQQEKDTWFPSKSVKSAKNETITQFLQLCLFPRCIFTAIDAVYCSNFVHTIHVLKTANFSTLLCYDRLFCNITYSVTSCTENEANRYGRFLCLMLETVMRWHSSKTIFEKECANYPGFVTKYRVSNHYTEACDHVGYENYRHVCHKWHYKIAKALITCIDSKDYVQIRNALIILIKILPHFPLLLKLNQIIERKIEKLREDEKNKREDLFVLATSYIGLLKNRSGSTIKEADFHLVNDKILQANAQIQFQVITQNQSQPQVQSQVLVQTQSQKLNEIILNGTCTNSEKSASNNLTNHVESKDSKSNENTLNEANSPPPVSPKSSSPSSSSRSSIINTESTRSEKNLKDTSDLSKNDEIAKTEENNDEKQKSSKQESGYDKNSDSLSTKDVITNGVHSSRRYHDAECDREVKRRKTGSPSTKNVLSSISISSPIRDSKRFVDERIHQESSSSADKKDRSSNRSSSSRSSKDYDDKKDRRNLRKRDHLEDDIYEQKRRKDDDRESSRQNGDVIESSFNRSKHRSTRDEKSPHSRENRERYYEDENRDKQYSLTKKRK